MCGLLTKEDYDDLMGKLTHLKDGEERCASPRIIATPCGTMHNHEVLLLEDSAKPQRRRTLSLQAKVNSILNPPRAPTADEERMVAAPCGAVHAQADVLLIENGSPSKRRRSLSSMRKRDSIINRSEFVPHDEDQHGPHKMVASPCGKILPQEEIKLLMSPTSVLSDHKHFGDVPKLVL